MEQTYSMRIVSPVEPDNFMVVGWKVAKKLPTWVCNANSWIDFINGKEEEEWMKRKKRRKMTKRRKKRRK